MAAAGSTASKWYQSKRIPLYVAVAGGLIGAVTFFTTNRATHPEVQLDKRVRQDGLPEEEHIHPEAGKAHHESSGRKMSRDLGLHDGHNSDGIFPNTKIAKKMGDLLGTTPSEEPEKKGPAL